MNLMSLSWPRLLCLGTLALLSQLAHAQYSWIDDKGMRVFSDRPPPPSTPAERILKAPRGVELAAPAAAGSAEPAAASGAASAAAKPAAPTWTEREADYRKRTAAREKADQLAEDKRRTEHASECAWARGTQQDLTTSRRLARTNAKGERVEMSDDDRAVEMKKVQRTLQGCS
jgi:hypothetical protein